jgi:hypothetical protein
MMRWIVFFGILATSSPAFAFHEVASFSRTANSGGGAGLYFTGSPRFKGYDCTICHVDAARRISVEIDSALEAGVYTPGLIYPVTVRLVGEHRGLDSAFNPNTFTADFTDAAGIPVGLVSSDGRQVILESERTVGVAEGFGEGETEWRFSWWSPAEGGAATLHIAMLDGDGASDPVRRFIDPLGDDVATFTLDVCPVDTICEKATQKEPADVAPMSCNIAAGSRQSGWAFLLLVLMMALWTKSRKAWKQRC